MAPSMERSPVMRPKIRPSFQAKGKFLSQSLKVTDLKLAISAAQEPKAKIATKVPHQKIASTKIDTNRERFKATSAKK